MYKSIGRLVSILYRKNQVYLNIALKPYNITTSELFVVHNLYRKDGITQEEMASYMMIDKAAMARSIPALIEKGYLRKEKDAVDKRANRIYLTEYAMSKKDDLTNILKDWNEIITEGMNEEELNTMYSVLERIVERVETVDLKEIRRN
jgi:DNA-binding MarR family transcriptional regulator